MKGPQYQGSLAAERLKAAEAAAEFGVLPTTLVRWLKSGRWPTRPSGEQGWLVTPGGRYLVYRDALERAKAGDVNLL